MKIASRTLAVALATLIAALGSLDAQGRGGGHRGGGHHHHRHWGPGLFLAGVAIGIVGSRHYYGAYHGGPWYPGYHGGPWYPGYPGYGVPAPLPGAYSYHAPPPPPHEPAGVRAPDPIFYPRNGQSPGQTEADRQACNRWATTQPSAMADASVFHRATLACMEGRGYTVR